MQEVIGYAGGRFKLEIPIMRFKHDVLEGVLLKRYKRFFADVKVGKSTVVAHVPNSGSMKGCQEPGSPCVVTHNPDPKRKLHYTLEMVQTPTTWVGVNTSHPNRLVMELWESKKYSPWKKWDQAKAEVKINDQSRIDFLFTNAKNQRHYVEVKNVSMAKNDIALFPDSVTERGQKHLMELMELKKQGHSAEILFVIQRTDIKLFSPADDIDPEYGRLLRQSIEAGVTATALGCSLKKTGIELLPNPIPIKI